MSRDELPEPWRSVLERKGIDSKRGLAAKADISPQTAKRLIDGIGKPSAETVEAVAKALDLDRSVVWGLAGAERPDHGDWQLPADLTSQLDEEQRAAVLAVVRAMVPRGKTERGEADGDAAPTKTPGSGPDAGQVVALPRAARRGQSKGRQLREQLGGVGEESQDTGNEDPS